MTAKLSTFSSQALRKAVDQANAADAAYEQAVDAAMAAACQVVLRGGELESAMSSLRNVLPDSEGADDCLDSEGAAYGHWLAYSDWWEEAAQDFPSVC